MNYWLYKQDIARLAAIGVPNYSFSISWTRIVPFGKVGSPINEEGLRHYEDVVETCLEYGIRYVVAGMLGFGGKGRADRLDGCRPIVTLTHADPPLNTSCKLG